MIGMRLPAGWITKPLVIALALAPAGAAMSSQKGAGQASPRFDVILRGGSVMDGSGGPAFNADVALNGDRIVAIGDLRGSSARQEIDVSGLAVAPGFMNIHDHSEPGAIATASNLLTQGVTTAILNPDGGGETDIAQELKSFADHGLAINLGAYIGFNAVRKAVVGETDRRPTSAEIERMRGLIEKNLNEGAWGVSAGLDYPPGYFAHTDEVIRVVSAAALWRTNFPNHERLTPETGWSSRVGIRETLTIARSAGLMPVITHIKAQGRDQGSAPLILAEMRGSAGAAQAAADVYPYLAGQNVVGPLIIPNWALSGGRPALLERLKDPSQRRRIVTEAEAAMAARFGGPGGAYILSEHEELTDIAREMGVSAGEAFVRLAEKGLGATILRFGAEPDLEAFLRNDATAIACDCGAVGPTTQVHPRYFGTFPRVLGHYARDEHIIAVEEAVRRMTALPASIVGIVDRGRIADGMAADLTIFSPSEIGDLATYDEPRNYSQGVRFVFVNGKLVLENGKRTAATPGRVLARTEHMPSRIRSPDVERSVSASGVARDADNRPRYRFSIDVRQNQGARSASGIVRVTDLRAARKGISVGLGTLQVADGWASFTTILSFGPNRQRAATIIVDRSDPRLASRRATVIIQEPGEPAAAALLSSKRVTVRIGPAADDHATHALPAH